MMTIFTILRPLKGLQGVIQRNSIESWMMLEPQPEILLFGKLNEVGQPFKGLGLTVLDVECSRAGTPLVSDMVEKAHQMASYSLMVMANSDNIYMSCFTQAIRDCAVAFERFLMIGQRWNLPITKPLTFDSMKLWETDLREATLEVDDREHHAAMDYLAYRGWLWGPEFPKFRVGCKGYDNWMVWRAWSQEAVPVVDVSETVMVIHQDHPQAKETRTYLDEIDQNRRFTEIRGDIAYSTHRLTADGIWKR